MKYITYIPNRKDLIPWTVHSFLEDDKGSALIDFIIAKTREEGGFDKLDLNLTYSKWLEQFPEVEYEGEFIETLRNFKLEFIKDDNCIRITHSYSDVVVEIYEVNDKSDKDHLLEWANRIPEDSIWKVTEYEKHFYVVDHLIEQYPDIEEKREVTGSQMTQILRAFFKYINPNNEQIKNYAGIEIDKKETTSGLTQGELWEYELRSDYLNLAVDYLDSAKDITYFQESEYIVFERKKQGEEQNG